MELWLSEAERWVRDASIPAMAFLGRTWVWLLLAIAVGFAAWGRFQRRGRR